MKKSHDFFEQKNYEKILKKILLHQLIEKLKLKLIN